MTYLYLLVVLSSNPLNPTNIGVFKTAQECREAKVIVSKEYDYLKDRLYCVKVQVVK